MQPPFLASFRSREIVRRPWRPDERRVIVRGLVGRCSVALEPLICAFVFLAITIVPFFSSTREVVGVASPARFTLAQVLAPIFGLAALAFFAYAAGLLIAPLRALSATYRPLFVIDGYVRYRVDGSSACFIAVLDHDRTLIGEWSLTQRGEVRIGTYAALVEYSQYGGIHRIDGRETGILPRTFMPFGIGNCAYDGWFSAAERR